MIYLSVDLDFWDVLKGKARFPRRFFDNLAGLSVPRHLVVSHEKMVPHINRHRKSFDTVVNIDYHSDIVVDKGPLLLGDGCWANFVEGKEDKAFVWSYPSWSVCYERRMGLCGATNPFLSTEWSGWKRLSHGQRFFPPWKLVAAVGIAVSPDYISEHLHTQFCTWLRSNHVYFTKDRAASALVRRLKRKAA